MQNPEFVTINDKKYKVSDLSENAIQLVNNVSVIQQKIADKQTDVQIFQVSADTLMSKLTAELVNVKEVVETKPE